MASRCGWRWKDKLESRATLAFYGGFEAVFFKSSDVALNSFSNIEDGFLFGAALANTTGQAGALCYPIVIFTWIKDNLTHFLPHNYYSIEYIIFQIRPAEYSRPATASRCGWKWSGGRVVKLELDEKK
jgi:hypothetical protein